MKKREFLIMCQSIKIKNKKKKKKRELSIMCQSIKIKNKKKKKKRELSIMCYLFLIDVSLAIRGVRVFRL